MRVLAGDVGGTNTRFAVWDVATRRPVFERVYRSASAAGLGELLEGFTAEAREALGGDRGQPPAEALCVGVAGPVEGHLCRATNLPWVVDVRELARRTGIGRARLVNDFHAMAAAVPALGPDDVVSCGGGSPVPGAPIAVLGPGTGLGVGFLFRPPGASDYEVVASEGGHADFAPRTPLEAALLRHLAGRHGRVSTERVLSGPGLVDLFEFLRGEDSLDRQLTDATRAALAAAPDPAAVITGHGVEGRDPVCAVAVALFAAVLGAAAGNLALTVLARGGVFVGGGIAPRIVDYLRSSGMREAFEDKGRFQGLLAEIPLAVIVHPQPGLLGAAVCAARTR